MTTKLVITLLFISGAILSNAQYASLNSSGLERAGTEDSSDKPANTFEKEAEKVYLDEKENVYVNKSLPLYLKFSTEPDGETYDLNTSPASSRMEPVYLDTEGANYIRTKWAVDPTTKEYYKPLREVEIEVFADGRPPVMKHKFASSHVYSSSGVVYYGKDLAFRLSAWDQTSGVRENYISINDGRWESSNRIDFSNMKAGSYEVSFFSVDNVNNYSETKDIEIIFDNVAPTSTLIHSLDKSFIYGPRTKVRLEVEEDYAGLRASYFKIDNGRYITYSNQTLPATLSDGEYDFTYYSVDNVRNEETPNRERIYLDKIAPEVTLHATSSFEKSKVLYVAKGSKISLDATDNKSGVNFIKYTISNRSTKVYSDPFLITEYEGRLDYVYFHGVDRVGNKSVTVKKPVFVDIVKPQTTVEFIGDSYEIASRFYVNANTKIKLNASDAHSGVDYSEFASNGTAYNKYSSPFSLINDGFNGILYHSVDRVGNTELSESIDVYLDTKGPTIIHNFSYQPIAEGEIPTYPVGTRLFLGATDDYSGTNTITYKMNDLDPVFYSSPKTIDISEKRAFKRGNTYVIEVTTTDFVNNVSRKEITFKIED